MDSAGGPQTSRPNQASGDSTEWQTADRATDALISAAARVSKGAPGRKPTSDRSRGPLVAAAALLLGGLGVWLVTRGDGSGEKASVANEVSLPVTDITTPGVSQTTLITVLAQPTTPPTDPPTVTQASTIPATPTDATLVPAAGPNDELVAFSFTLKPDGKAYARGSLPDEEAVRAVLASGEAVVGAGNVVLRDVTTNSAATFTPSQATLVATSFYYTQGNGEISLDHQLRLDVIASMMMAKPTMIAYISGFSDSTGGTAGNLALSQTRIDNIAAYLTAAGIVEGQFRLAAVGEEQAVGDNATESGRALNRRVDIQFDGQNLAP